MPETRLRGTQKAAVLLMFLGEEPSAEVLRELDEPEIEMVISEIPKLGDIDPTTLDLVIREFTERVVKEGYLTEVGKDFAERVVKKALKESKAETILKRVYSSERLQLLKKLDSRIIFDILKTEHPQTIAFVLAHLTPMQTADILSRLPENVQKEIVWRIAKLERLMPGTLEEVVDTLASQTESRRILKGGELGGPKAVAEILNLLKRAEANEVLRRVEDEDPELAEVISQHMFTFEDLLHIDDRGIQLILREVTNEDLVLALKMASDELKEKIFRNMSQRAAEMVKEDLEVRGPSRVRDVEHAQQNIVKIARTLEDEGKIVIKGRGAEELFV